MVRHLEKLALKDKYQQLEREYEKALDMFSKMLQQRQRKVEQLEGIVSGLLEANF